MAATSPLIRQALVEDYGVEQPLFLPPCIDPSRFHPRDIDDEHEIYEFIGRQCGLSAAKVRQSKIITEISRTDRTKRKDVLIRAFAKVHQEFPDTLLVVSIDKHEESLYSELWALIRESGHRLARGRDGQHLAMVARSVRRHRHLLLAVGDGRVRHGRPGSGRHEGAGRRQPH